MSGFIPRKDIVIIIKTMIKCIHLSSYLHVAHKLRLINEPHHEKNRIFAKTKAQIIFAVTVFATRIVHFLFFLNPKLRVSSHLLKLHRPVCVRPGRKPRRPVFSRRGLIYITFLAENITGKSCVWSVSGPVQSYNATRL